MPRIGVSKLTWRRQSLTTGPAGPAALPQLGAGGDDGELGSAAVGTAGRERIPLISARRRAPPVRRRRCLRPRRRGRGSARDAGPRGAVGARDAGTAGAHEPDLGGRPRGRSGGAGTTRTGSQARRLRERIPGRRSGTRNRRRRTRREGARETAAPARGPETRVP